MMIVQKKLKKNISVWIELAEDLDYLRMEAGKYWWTVTQFIRLTNGCVIEQKKVGITRVNVPSGNIPSI